MWRVLTRDVVAVFALLAVGLTVGSVFRSHHPFDSVLMSLITLVHLRFGAAVYFLARAEPEADIRALFRWLMLGLGALAVLTIWRFQLPAPAASVPGGVIEWGSALPGFINVRHFGSWTGAIAAGLMLALGLALPFLPDHPDFHLYVTGDGQSADAASGGRLALWHATFERWLDAPLFGWGSGSTFWEVYVGWTHTQPHNVVLQFLISWGVVGAAGGLWLLGRAIVATHRTGMDDARLRPLTGMLYSLLFMSLLEGMLHYPRFIMMIAVGFAVLFATRDRAGRSLHDLR